jgi:hypothetical protein
LQITRYLERLDDVEQRSPLKKSIDGASSIGGTVSFCLLNLIIPSIETSPYKSSQRQEAIFHSSSTQDVESVYFIDCIIIVTTEMCLWGTVRPKLKLAVPTSHKYHVHFIVIVLNEKRN